MRAVSVVSPRLSNRAWSFGGTDFLSKVTMFARRLSGNLSHHASTSGGGAGPGGGGPLTSGGSGGAGGAVLSETTMVQSKSTAPNVTTPKPAPPRNGATNGTAP